MAGVRAQQPCNGLERCLMLMARGLLAVCYILSTAAVPAASQTRSFTCTYHQEVQSAPLRSSAGFTVVLKMHSDDDHWKDSHLCETGYTLAITHPDGTSQQPVDVGGSEGEDWDRPLLFRTEGFSPDGKRAFLFISERPRHGAWIDAVEYDLVSGTSNDVYLKQPRHLNPACAATLHISGTDPDGLMVLATNAENGCLRQEMWQLKPNKQVGGRNLIESPGHLPSQTTVKRLIPGSQPQP